MASSRLAKIDFALLTDNSFDPLPHVMLDNFLLARQVSIAFASVKTYDK